jgi:hypothetical protein
MVKNMLQDLLDWSEVWAPLIPLVVLSFKGSQPKYTVPVIVYLWFALVVDAIIDAGWKFGNCAPGWMQPNVYLYNVHSIGRFIAFSTFFYLLGQPFRSRLDKVLPLLAALFIIVNFTFFEKFYHPILFSSRLFATESGLLLFYCLRYYLFQSQAGKADERGADFWVITGLSIYVVFNFFYFLFYTTLISKKQYELFVMNMWNFHNVTFVILCIFIARAFYVAGHK